MTLIYQVSSIFDSWK